MRYRMLALLLVFLFTGVFFYTQTTAQEADTCPSLVDDALNQLETACVDAGRNFACYGNTAVDASFTREVEPEFFTMPGDEVQLIELQNIAAQPLNLEDNTWGIALMKVLANLPGTLPGQAVVMLVVGDTYVENDVDPASAFQSETVVPVETAREIVLRDAPRPGGNAVGTVPTGAQLAADALAEGTGWIRVVYEEQFGWIPPAAITMPRGISILPTIDPETTQTPMQAFYFSTGIGNSECEETPDTLIVQGPEELEVDISANAVDIRIGSTIALLTYEMLDPPQMEIITLEDEAEVFCPDGTSILIPEGYSILGELSELVDLGLNDMVDNRFVEECVWTDPQPLTIERILQVAGPAFSLSTDVLNYPLGLPVIATPTPEPTNTPTTIPFVPPRVVVTNTPVFVPSATPFVVQPSATPVPIVEDDDDDDDDDDNVVTIPFDLALTTGGDTTVAQGDVVTLTFTVANSGTDNATGVDVSLINLGSIPGTLSTATPSTGTFDTVANDWALGTIPAGGTATLQLTYAIDPTAPLGTYPNIGLTLLSSTPADTNAANNDDFFTLTVNAQADIGVTITANDTNPDEGDFFDFTITVTNNGPNDATNVQITDDIHAYPFSEATANVPPVGTYTFATGVWDVGALPAGTSQTFNIAVQTDAGSGGSIYNVVASVTNTSLPDPDNTNDSATVAIDVIAPAIPPNTIFVTTPTDNRTIGDGLCSLAEAIEVANTDVSTADCPFTGGTADIIEFSVGGPIIVNSTLFDITTAMTIEAGGLTIDGSGSPDGLFKINTGGGDLTLNDATITGNTNMNGGGINNGGITTLNNVNITGTAALQGGAIANVLAGTLTMNGGTVTGTASDAGCVYNEDSTATFNNVTFSSCTATTGGAETVAENAGTATIAFSNVTIGAAASPNCNALVTDNGGNTGGDGTCF